MESIFSLLVMEAQELYGIENPHDKLFKDLLDDEEELKAFITEYIGINIKQEEIERYNNKYITNQYKIYEADMVYKIKGKEIYFLIEHQSTIDERMPYRILTYYTELLKEIIDKKENRRKNYKYPLIKPIVLYTGEKEWKVEQIVENRFEFPTEESYVNRLRNRGINKIAQKVGEEAVETVIAALVEKEEDFINETSDLLFHLLVLLKEKNISLESIAKNLESRHQ